LRNSTFWQTAFIRENLPVIGYFAWQGFQQTGWGLLCCYVEPLPVNTDLRLHSWNFTTRFVSGQYIATFLQELEIPLVDVVALVPEIEQYNPQHEIMLLLNSGQSVNLQSVNVCWLKNLVSTPIDCYGQVLDRWEEFMLDAHDHASL
jgi:hypothetical protein